MDGQTTLWHKACLGQASLSIHHYFLLQIAIPCYILGDSAYPLMTGLMRPYLDTGNLAQDKTAFNHKLSSTRMIVENANARLKNKWRRLKKIYSKTFSRAEEIIESSIILHNFVLQHDSDLCRSDEHYDVYLPNMQNVTPEAKRDIICNFIR